MELLIAVVIVGILAATALPQYGRTVEARRWQEARDMLLTIYAGEQTYATINNGNFFCIVLPAGCPNTGTTADWQTIYMEDPTSATISYTINASPTPPSTTFTATATRIGGGPCNNRTQTINAQRVFGGTGNWLSNGSCP